jgi:hypothetical protein
VRDAGRALNHLSTCVEDRMSARCTRGTYPRTLTPPTGAWPQPTLRRRTTP